MDSKPALVYLGELACLLQANQKGNIMDAATENLNDILLNLVKFLQDEEQRRLLAERRPT